MSHQKITCRIAIQVCVGRLPSGRKSHRTFSLRHVRPDVSMEAIMVIIRALAPVLEYPITKVTKVTKIVLFSSEDAAVAPAPQVAAEPVYPAGRIIPFPIFPVTEPPPAHMEIARGAARSSPCALPFAEGQKGFMPGRAPPAAYDLLIKINKAVEPLEQFPFAFPGVIGTVEAFKTARNDLRFFILSQGRQQNQRPISILFFTPV